MLCSEQMPCVSYLQSTSLPGLWRALAKVGRRFPERAAPPGALRRDCSRVEVRGLGTERSTRRARPSRAHFSLPSSDLPLQSSDGAGGQLASAHLLRTRLTSPGPRRPGGEEPGRGQEAVRTFRCRRSRWLLCCRGPRLPVLSRRRSRFSPSLLLGWEEAVRPRNEWPTQSTGAPGKWFPLVLRRARRPRSTPLLLTGPVDEPRPPSPIQTTDRGHELTSMAGPVSQQAALPQARSPSSCGPRRQNCC